jgi:hypothetical protein
VACPNPYLSPPRVAVPSCRGLHQCRTASWGTSRCGEPWVQVPALSLPAWVCGGRRSPFPEPQFPHLQDG